MRWLFTPPLFADEEQTQTARQLYVILWTIILAVTVVMALNIVILPEAIWRWVLTLGSVGTICLALLHLTRRGQTHLTSKLMVLALWGIVTVLASTAGGIHTPAVNGYLLIVFIAGLLLGAKAGIITAVGCSLTGMGLIYAAKAGILPPSAQYNEFAFWTALTFYLAVIVGLQYLATDAIKKSLRQVQQELAERRQTETALRESEARYRLISENTADVIWTLSFKTGKFTYVSPAVQKLRGYTSDEVMNQTMAEALTPESLEITTRLLQQGIAERKPGDTSHYKSITLVDQPCKDGSVVSTEVVSTMFFDEQGQPIEIIGISRDITERKRAEEALRESEARYRALVESSPDAVTLIDLQGRVMMRNRQAEIWFGPIPAEIENAPSALQTFAPEDRPRAAENMRLTFERGKIQTEYTLLKKNGARFPVELNGAVVVDDLGHRLGFVALTRDITARKQAEEQIKTSLREKEALIRELYHRTKNNMQVICAMLDLQASYTANTQVTQVFEEMNNRIRSMALVHQMLYQSQNLSSINLQEYISNLTDLLMSSYSVSPRQVSLKLDLENVFILIDMAVPCGLILNELITNALKHAFPGDRTGEITVRLRRRGDDTIELIVADNGVGTPVGFDFRKHGKMGVQTILALGERQLQGEVKFDSPPGFTCVIRFRDTLYSARV